MAITATSAEQVRNVPKSRTAVDVPETERQYEQRDVELEEHERIGEWSHDQLDDRGRFEQSLVVPERGVGEDRPEQELGAEGIAEEEPRREVGQEVGQMRDDERGGRFDPVAGERRGVDDNDQSCREQQRVCERSTAGEDRAPKRAVCRPDRRTANRTPLPVWVPAVVAAEIARESTANTRGTRRRGVPMATWVNTSRFRR
ncbi:hypothetical protein [Natronorubrum bangense]|uniref:hypothetical protein n=1 Tax=Natronorubrum bangense TaxID=61858 RepID=UPI000677EC3F